MKTTHIVEFICDLLGVVVAMPAYGEGHGHSLMAIRGITYYTIREEE